MQKQFNPQQHQLITEDNDSIDIKKWLVIILANWYYFGICIIIAGVSCYYLNRTITPIFRTSSIVLIEEDKGQNKMGAQVVMQDFGIGPYTNVNNQLLLLSSYSLVKKAASKLPLEFDYYREFKLRQYSYYMNSPIKATLINEEIGGDIVFKTSYINDTEYSLTVSGYGDYDDVIIAQYNDTISIYDIFLILEKTPFFSESMSDTYFQYRSIESLTNEFFGKLKLEFVAEDATFVRASLESSNPKRDIDFLDMLVNEFLNDNLERKNIEAIRTIDFISEQLYGVADSLAANETSLQEYRSTNNVINISSQAELLIQNASKLETQRAQLKIKQEYYQYLKEYMSKDKDESIIAPSTIGIEDPLLNIYIQKYSEIQINLQMLAPKAPYREVAKSELEKLKYSIIEATNDAVIKTQISIEDINIQIASIVRQTEALPAKERKLLGIQRELTVVDSYYTYLLQKRSEAQIQQASNSPDNILIDSARVTQRTNGKETRTNYIIALLLGLGLPLGVLILTEVLNTKIRCRKDIEHATNIPILGSIIHKLSYHKITTLDSPRSSFTESFRALRTRLNFIQANNESMKIMVTSSLSGEGKTFIAINLAGIYALSGKKTLLIGYDLRKPKIADYLGKNQKYGLSNYLAGTKNLDEITINYRENLDIIYSGTVPPNPGELCANDIKNTELFKETEEKYDVIIIDSTPIGAVTDAFLIGQYADCVLYIAKHNFTDKEIFSECIKQLDHNNIKQVNVVVNDVSVKQSVYRFGRYVYGKKYNYMYGYSSGYGYGYGYGNEYGYTDS